MPRKKNGTLEASSLYLQMLMGRKGAYKVLYNALVETNQCGAARVLVRVPPELLSNPLTYLGMSMKTDEFQNVELEVNGKTVKLYEFLPQADYQKMERIFRETISEVEFHDSFVTKEQEFVLVKYTIPQKPMYYSPRFLSNRVKLNEFIFKADCPDVFVFRNNIQRYILSQLSEPHFTETSISQLTNITTRFIYLDEYEHWTLLKRVAKVPIHLINYEDVGNQFVLEDSSSPSSDIPGELHSRNISVYLSEDDFIQQQLSEVSEASPIVCILDTPGMGKTFLLSNLARRMTENYDGRISVFIPLTTFSEEIYASFQNTTGEPEASLILVLKYVSPSQQNTELLLKLVKAELLWMEIFFDGFDEISGEKIDLTKQVIRSIKTSLKNVNIYITSRPHMRYELEDDLGVLAHDILAVTHQNQVDLLVQFWKNYELNSDRALLQSYATRCLGAVNKFLTKYDKEIAGTPLLCQLIAGIYADKDAFHSIKSGQVWDVPQNVSGIYKKFIENKINLVANNQMEFDNMKSALIWHGLLLIFAKNVPHEDKQFEAVKNLMASPQVTRIGIIQKSSNGTWEFIHRTFAQYLVAEYFSTILKNWETEKNSNNTSMFDLIVNCLHSEISYFSNSFLGEINISEELITHTANSISSTSAKEIIFMLYTCCEHNLQTLFIILREILIKCDKSWFAESFAVEKVWFLLNVCIKHSSSQLFYDCIQLFTEVFNFDVAQLNTFDKTETLLQLAVYYANYEVVEYFVDRVPLQGQPILKKCVWETNEIEKRENILHLLINKDPTLLNEIPDILLIDFIDVRLFQKLVKLGANLSAVSEHGDNCVILAADTMSPIDFHKLVKFLLIDCRAEYLFVGNEKWKHPLPQIIQMATLAIAKCQRRWSCYLKFRATTST